MKSIMNGNDLRILVTGGAGFIGSQIVQQLLTGPESFNCREVIVFDDFSRGRRENLGACLDTGKVTVIDGDLRDRKAVAEVMSGIDLVFHQAAIRITRCAAEPRLALEVLVEGTFNVLEEACSCGVKKVLAASSASVYGDADEFPTTEKHHPYNNRTIYGAAKAFNEGLLRSFHEMHGLDYVALRPFNVYGPGMDTHGAYTEVFIRWMERIEKGLPPLIFGDGKQTMDFVYVEDVARAYLLAAKANVTDQVFNLGSGVETSLDDLARTLLHVMGSDLTVEYGPERKVNAVRRRLAETSNTRDLLGFEARVQLEEGLGSLVDWWRDQNPKTVNEKARA
jgi:UDP-glucose 4-epimerase